MPDTYPNTMPDKPSSPFILAVASGKGGVGKSFIAANLTMAFAAHGKKSVLVDLDLGSANAHTCLGMEQTSTTLSQFLHHPNMNINTLVEPAGSPLAGLIGGSNDDLNISNLKYFQKMKILRNLRHIDADFVILDLGAGTGFNTLDFFLYADQGILTAMPEPTSVENVYRFAKAIVTRLLKNLPRSSHALINSVLSRQKEAGKIRSFSQLVANMLEEHPEYGNLILNNLQKLNLGLVINQVMEPADTRLGDGMTVVFQKYFGIKLQLLGCLYHDTHIIHALKQRQPYYRLFPQSRNALCLHRMAERIIHKQQGHTSAKAAQK